jgi:hypothetical protein
MVKKYKWLIYWGVLTIIAVLYVGVSIKYKDNPSCTVFIQTGGILLTLIAMFLIMLQTIDESNKSASNQIVSYQQESLKQIKAVSDATNTQIENFQKLTEKQIEAIQSESEKQINTYRDESEKQINHNRESTQKQIDAFVSQTNEITNRLEDVAELLMKISEQNVEMLETEKELNKLEEIKWQKRTEELEQHSVEKNMAINRIKPNLHFMLEEGSYIVVFTHLYLNLYNNGGDAKAITINIHFINSYHNTSTMLTSTCRHLDSLQRHSIRLGRAKNYNYYDMVAIEILVKDVEQREYHANLKYNKVISTWCGIPLNERTQLLT